MFLTLGVETKGLQFEEPVGRNPLKSGQCFLPELQDLFIPEYGELEGRNPLKSGQCFLHSTAYAKRPQLKKEVAIPSNRVNVSY